MLYLNPPENFNPQFEVASCFIEQDGKILLLHRHDGKIGGNKWGSPAGKVEAGESPLQAIAREAKEETGLTLALERFQYFKKVFVRYPEFDFVFHIFSAKLEFSSEIKLNKEHKDFIWATPASALRLDLILDEDACIKIFYGI